MGWSGTAATLELHGATPHRLPRHGSGDGALISQARKSIYTHIHAYMHRMYVCFHSLALPCCPPCCWYGCAPWPATMACSCSPCMQAHADYARMITHACLHQGFIYTPLPSARVKDVCNDTIGKSRPFNLWSFNPGTISLAVLQGARVR